VWQAGVMVAGVERRQRIDELRRVGLIKCSRREMRTCVMELSLANLNRRPLTQVIRGLCGNSRRIIRHITASLQNRNSWLRLRKS